MIKLKKYNIIYLYMIVYRYKIDKYAEIYDFWKLVYSTTLQIVNFKLKPKVELYIGFNYYIILKEYKLNSDAK